MREAAFGVVPLNMSRHRLTGLTLALLAGVAGGCNAARATHAEVPQAERHRVAGKSSPGTHLPKSASPSPASAEPEEPTATPDAIATGPALRENAGPLDALDEEPALRQAAEVWLAERQKAASEEDVEIAQVSRFREAPGSAAILLVLTRKDVPDISRRVFGLISTKLDGAQTLEMTSEPCGELQPSLVDLHGDGARFAVFTEVGGGYHCHLTGSTIAYELKNERWLEAIAPSYASDTQWINGDQIPDFSTSLAIFDLGECNYAACGDYFFRVDVTGYESWDGSKFTSAGRYKAFYEAQRRELVELAKSLGPPEGCDQSRLRDGARAFAYTILSGRGRSEALALARRFFHGVQTDLCIDNGVIDTLPQIEQELLKSQSALEAAR